MTLQVVEQNLYRKKDDLLYLCTGLSSVSTLFPENSLNIFLLGVWQEFF